MDDLSLTIVPVVGQIGTSTVVKRPWHSRPGPTGFGFWADNGQSGSNVKSSRIRQLIAFSSCFIRRPGGRETGLPLCPQRKWTLRDLFGFACAFSAVRFVQRKPRIGGDFARFSGNNSRISLHFRLYGGEGGIRTLGTGVSPYNGLANRRIRPLCHLSGVLEL